MPSWWRSWWISRLAAESDLCIAYADNSVIVRSRAMLVPTGRLAASLSQLSKVCHGSNRSAWLTYYLHEFADGHTTNPDHPGWSVLHGIHSVPYSIFQSLQFPTRPGSPESRCFYCSRAFERQNGVAKPTGCGVDCPPSEIIHFLILAGLIARPFYCASIMRIYDLDAQV